MSVAVGEEIYYIDTLYEPSIEKYGTAAIRLDIENRGEDVSLVRVYDKMVLIVYSTYFVVYDVDQYNPPSYMNISHLDIEIVDGSIVGLTAQDEENGDYDVYYAYLLTSAKRLVCFDWQTYTIDNVDIDDKNIIAIYDSTALTEDLMIVELYGVGTIIRPPHYHQSIDTHDMFRLCHYNAMWNEYGVYWIDDRTGTIVTVDQLTSNIVQCAIERHEPLIMALRTEDGSIYTIDATPRTQRSEETYTPRLVGTGYSDMLLVDNERGGSLYGVASDDGSLVLLSGEMINYMPSHADVTSNSVQVKRRRVIKSAVS